MIPDQTWVEVEYHGKPLLCHPDSWLVRFGKPIQDMSESELIKIIEDESY